MLSEIHPDSNGPEKCSPLGQEMSSGRKQLIQRNHFLRSRAKLEQHNIVFQDFDFESGVFVAAWVSFICLSVGGRRKELGRMRRTCTRVQRKCLLGSGRGRRVSSSEQANVSVAFAMAKWLRASGTLVAQSKSNLHLDSLLPIDFLCSS